MKYKLRITLLAITILSLLVITATALAAGEILPRQLISNGGGSVNASGVELRSAIAQPVAGVVQAGSLTLCSGYLCTPSTKLIYLPLILK